MGQKAWAARIGEQVRKIMALLGRYSASEGLKTACDIWSFGPRTPIEALGFLFTSSLTLCIQVKSRNRAPFSARDKSNLSLEMTAMGQALAGFYSASESLNKPYEAQWTDDVELSCLQARSQIAIYDDLVRTVVGCNGTDVIEAIHKLAESRKPDSLASHAVLANTELNAYSCANLSISPSVRPDAFRNPYLWAFMTPPILKMPFVQLDGAYYCFAPEFFLNDAFQSLKEIACKSPAISSKWDSLGQWIKPKPQSPIVEIPVFSIDKAEEEEEEAIDEQTEAFDQSLDKEELEDEKDAEDDDYLDSELEESQEKAEEPRDDSEEPENEADEDLPGQVDLFDSCEPETAAASDIPFFRSEEQRPEQGSGPAVSKPAPPVVESEPAEPRVEITVEVPIVAALDESGQLKSEQGRADIAVEVPVAAAMEESKEEKPAVQRQAPILEPDQMHKVSSPASPEPEEIHEIEDSMLNAIIEALEGDKDSSPQLAYIRSLGIDDRRDLRKMLDSAIKAYMATQQDKMFSIPSQALSFILTSPSRDVIRSDEQRMNLASLLVRNRASMWHAVELCLSEQGELVSSSAFSITRESFTQVQWKLVLMRLARKQ